MKVSVALTVYNKAPFLNEVLESIFAQSLGDYEIVAVDDKSTDESLQVLRSIRDPRLRIIALPENLGHPGATQTAFEQSRGEYIIRCDADDRAARTGSPASGFHGCIKIGMSGGAAIVRG